MATFIISSEYSDVSTKFIFDDAESAAGHVYRVILAELDGTWQTGVTYSVLGEDAINAWGIGSSLSKLIDVFEAASFDGMVVNAWQNKGGMRHYELCKVEVVQ